MSSFTLSPAETSKLKDNVPLAIFGLALIVIAIAAPGGMQGLLRRAGRWVRTRLAGPHRTHPATGVPRPTRITSPSHHLKSRKKVGVACIASPDEVSPSSLSPRSVRCWPHAACSNSNGGGAYPGVTATTVTVGTHQPLTGPAAPGLLEDLPRD